MIDEDMFPAPRESRFQVNLRRDDVPLMQAMLLWDDGYTGACECSGHYHAGDCPSEGEQVKLAPIIADHDKPIDNPGIYDNATGACFDDWRGLSNDERLVRLLRDAWMCVVRDRVDHAAMHEALLAVPEFRGLMHPDELPDVYIVPRNG